MILCIAEKPSVAKDIAEILGARSRKDGYWEGNGFWVSWTFGHLCTLKEPHDYKESWKYWKLERWRRNLIVIFCLTFEVRCQNR